MISCRAKSSNSFLTTSESCWLMLLLITYITHYSLHHKYHVTCRVAWSSSVWTTCVSWCWCQCCCCCCSDYFVSSKLLYFFCRVARSSSLWTTCTSTAARTPRKVFARRSTASSSNTSWLESRSKLLKIKIISTFLTSFVISCQTLWLLAIYAHHS